MLGAVRAMLCADKVAVVTSSPVLAEEGVEWLQGFYEKLGLRGAHNTQQGVQDGKLQTKLQDVYLADIVYGDIASFQGHYLDHHFKKRVSFIHIFGNVGFA